jgi:predicted hotdog family 3-hydroxylacyl-ACP dehydratase
MRLIDDILSVDANAIHCVDTDHQAPSYPLRLDGKLFGCVLVELGAQAAAVHVSLFGTEGAHTGLVLSINNADVRVDRVETVNRLTVRAWRLQSLNTVSSYRFEVLDGSARILAAQVLLSMRWGSE